MYQLYYTALLMIINFRPEHHMCQLHSIALLKTVNFSHVNDHDTLKSNKQIGILHRTGNSVIVNYGNDVQFGCSKTSNG